MTKKLSPEKIDATTYGFGKKSDGTYRFTLKYQAGKMRSSSSR